MDLRTADIVLRRLHRTNQEPTTTEGGQNLAKIINALYAECSASSLIGVLEVFETAVRASLKYQKSRSHFIEHSIPQLSDDSS